MKKEKILGYDICNEESNEILKEIFNDFNKATQNFIVNINPEIAVKNYKNDYFRKEFNSQKYQIPDGIGIVLASKIKKGNIKERVTGIDFMGEICKESIKNSGKIFLYGAKKDVVEKAAVELQNKYPGIVISGTCDGYCESEIAIKKINDSDADILFVALGSPKQELFILENKEKLTKIKIFMPVGGSFDVISNNIKRAPNWVIKLNLEWLYRLIRQPWRFFRQLKLIKFIFLVIKEKRREKNGKD